MVGIGAFSRRRITIVYLTVTLKLECKFSFLVFAFISEQMTFNSILKDSRDLKFLFAFALFVI